MNLPNKFKFSAKHILIDKANNAILVAVTITVAVVIFSVVVTATFIKRMSYQSAVIGLRDSASHQLDTNIQAADAVLNAFKTFESSKESVIGTADKNSVVILNALPSKYDFPALTASLEKLVRDSGATMQSVTGIDTEAEAQQSSVSPSPIAIPFSLSVRGSYNSIQNLVSALERSIRPIKIISITIEAAGDGFEVSISAETYYQPEKIADISQGIVNADGSLSASSNQLTEENTP